MLGLQAREQRALSLLRALLKGTAWPFKEPTKRGLMTFEGERLCLSAGGRSCMPGLVLELQRVLALGLIQEVGAKHVYPA